MGLWALNLGFGACVGLGVWCKGFTAKGMAFRIAGSCSSHQDAAARLLGKLPKT